MSSAKSQLSVMFDDSLYSYRLRGKVVLKGRRPVGSTDDYDTDSDAADDDMTDLQSVRTERTSVTVSTCFVAKSLRSGLALLTSNLITSIILGEDTKVREQDSI